MPVSSPIAAMVRRRTAGTMKKCVTPYPASMRANASAPVMRRVATYLIASGLVGDPTAPVMGSAGATNMNS